MSQQSLRARASGDVATTEQHRQPTVADLINAQKGEIGRVLPKYMDPDRLARIVTTVIKQTPALARCDAASLLGAVMTCAQLGLEPGPLGEAYMVPYGNKVTFIPGYRGLIKLAWNSGRLQSIQAHVVHEADRFSYQYGLHPDLVHQPVLRGDRGPVIAVYAAAVFKDGGNAFVVLSVDEVEALRKRGGGRGGGPWTTDWDAMARKSAVRALARWLPMSSEMSGFQQAAALDGTVRSDYAAPVEAAGAVFAEDVPEQVEAAAVEGPPPAGVDPVTGEVEPEEVPGW